MISIANIRKQRNQLLSFLISSKNNFYFHQTMSKIILALLFVIIFTTCKKEHQKQEINKYRKTSIKMTEIDVDMSKTDLPFDSLMKFSSFIKLETTSENLVGSISQILFTKDRIIVVDRDNSNSISVYDMTGKFLNKIGRHGKGPSEYVFLWQVSLSYDRSMVVITDQGSSKLKYFDLNGNFIKAVSQPYWCISSEFIDETTIAVFESRGINLKDKDKSKPQLVITGLDGKVINSDFPSYQSQSFNYVTEFPLIQFESNLLFNPSFCDTIYKVLKEGFFPYYHLNIKNEEQIIINESTTNDKLNEQLDKRKVYFNGDYIELKDAVIFEMMGQGLRGIRFFIYSKQKNKSFYCNGTYYDTRLIFFMDKKFLYKDNSIVTQVQAEKILLYKNELYRLCKKEDIDLLMNNLTVDDNPVLFFYDINILDHE